MQPQQELLSTSTNELDKGTLSLSGWATLTAQHHHETGGVSVSYSGLIKNNNIGAGDDDVPQWSAGQDVRWDEAAWLV